MPDSKEIITVKNSFNFPVANSDKNNAIPNDIGTEIKIDKIEVTKVPYIKVKAPYCSDTGSQIFVTKNLNPNLLNAKYEFLTSIVNKRIIKLNKITEEINVILKNILSAKFLVLIKTKRFNNRQVFELIYKNKN